MNLRSLFSLTASLFVLTPALVAAQDVAAQDVTVEAWCTSDGGARVIVRSPIPEQAEVVAGPLETTVELGRIGATPQTLAVDGGCAVERVVVTSDGRTTTVRVHLRDSVRLFQSIDDHGGATVDLSYGALSSRPAEAGSGEVVPMAASGHTTTSSAVATSPAPRADAAPRPDGVRFRWGIQAAGGGEFVSNFAFGMGGLEGQIGVQVSELLGIYVQPYLAFGAGSIGSGVVGLTGTAGASLLVDFTFLDRLFVAVGGGYGILNNPHGPEIHVRLGGYPAMGFGENGYSRHGLVLAVDGRTFFLFSGPEVVPVMQVMGTIGYAAF